MMPKAREPNPVGQRAQEQWRDQDCAARGHSGSRACTGVFVMSDRLALGALNEARARGLRIPQDLALVGFDDIPEAALSDPPLTTVRQLHEEKGRRATAYLIAAMR